MKHLKVFSGLTHDGNTIQVRTIVAAKTKKRAAELLGISLSQLNEWWCETVNQTELDIATSSPETIFKASGIDSDDFAPKS